MKSQTRLIVTILLFLAGVFIIYQFSKQSSTFSFEFSAKQNSSDPELEKIVSSNLAEAKGHFAVYIEELVKPTSGESKPTPEEDLQLQQTSPDVGFDSSGVRLRKYVLNEKEFFPAASLYKLILLAAALKELEAGSLTGSGLKMEDTIIGSKSDLTKKFGALDFGYEKSPEKITYSVEEILERIGRISDNFAAIMLTEKLRQYCQASSYANCNDPLFQMAKELDMENTSFGKMADELPNTTASDMALFFRKLYLGEVVSRSASEKIMEILALTQINDRIPANLPQDVKVIHKTGELPYLRHDAGLIFPPNFPNSPNLPYLIVLLSKDLEFENEGVAVLANISKEVWDYFNQGD